MFLVKIHLVSDLQHKYHECCQCHDKTGKIHYHRYAVASEYCYEILHYFGFISELIIQS